VLTLVSIVPNFWCSLEVAAAEMHVCFVIKGYVWWKRTFLPMAAILVLHHKNMKLFTSHLHPHVIVRSDRRDFNQSICRAKEQKTRFQCLARAMPKSVTSAGAIKSAKILRRKSAKLLRRKSAWIWQCQLKRRD